MRAVADARHPGHAALRPGLRRDRVRLYLAAAGSRLAIPGTPDALVVGPERDFGGTLEADAWPRSQAAGFIRLKDIAGFAWRRRVWPIDEETDPDQLAEEIALANACHRAHR